MTDLGRLFDPGPTVVPSAEDKVSYGRRLTARKNAAIASGTNPVSGFPIDDEYQAEGLTCGDCFNHIAGRFHKCRLNNTGGPATDIRVSWPACTEWEPAEP